MLPLSSIYATLVRSHLRYIPQFISKKNPHKALIHERLPEPVLLRGQPQP